MLMYRPMQTKIAATVQGPGTRGNHLGIQTAGASMHMISIITSLLALSMLVPGCAAAVRGSNPATGKLPEIKKDCALCHASHNAKKGVVLLKKPVPELCIGCHPGRIAPNEHKVDIVPTMNVGQFPLTNGKMTCLTCHDPHQNPYGSLLRMPEPDLCIKCHPF